MLRSPGQLAEGLRHYMRGRHTIESDAAADILAETILYHRLWLLSHFEKRR